MPRRHIENVGSGSYIRLSLPEGLLRDATPGNSLGKLRDKFEDALISRGYLKGKEAERYGEEIRRNTRGTAGGASPSARIGTSCVGLVRFLGSIT